jgi:hypothetical protein
MEAELKDPNGKLLAKLSTTGAPRAITDKPRLIETVAA